MDLLLLVFTSFLEWQLSIFTLGHLGGKNYILTQQAKITASVLPSSQEKKILK